MLILVHVFVPQRAGYWAEEIVSRFKSGARSGDGVGAKPKVCIISSYPQGLVPYERSELSKECLRPSSTHLRDWQVSRVLPERWLLIVSHS